MAKAIVFTTLGWVYIVLDIAWALLLAAGLAFLYRHRRLPFLQIRKLPLVFTAILILHCYGAVCMLCLTVGQLVPCDAQFWIMSIYLPFGMALLQAANSQFLHVAKQQKRFAQFSDLEDHYLSEKSKPIDPSLPWWKRNYEQVRRMDKVTQILVYIGIAMVVELALTFLVYFGSEIFHPGYGIFNVKVPGTEQLRAAQCFQGWEWWLSIVWQFFWAWFYAPYMLYKTRHIEDTHGWRITTICCCIAGLPATPLWLAGLYAPGMAPLNAVWAPPQWYSLSIFFIEVFTIGIPCLQVYKTHNLKQETLDAIAAWERRNQGTATNPDAISQKSSGLASSTLAASSIAGKSARSKASSTDSRDSTLTMAALENVLKNNPQPLLEFAALKDFSGENVSFLSHVADWKRNSGLLKVGPTERYDTFVRAVRIYSHFISLEYSQFPVNISSRNGKELHHMFAKAAQQLNSRRHSQSSATPFGDSPSDCSTADLTAGGNNNGLNTDLQETLGKANLQAVSQMTDLTPDGMLDLSIPPAFNTDVFNDAEKEIKYLVLTNTWPKFVHSHDGRSSVQSRTGDRSDEKHMFDGARKYFCGIERIV
ncbi:hypothetical protein E8E14_003007 [Neopestalotiopsis sp. 37M]|nr:hypothetical protein E8E14_003007 [Neopestalotiopsis sp. 37M]